MRNKYTLLVITSLSVAASTIPAHAAAINLFEYQYNIDGTLKGSPGAPPGVIDAGFNYGTGLGNITFSITVPGPHFVGLFLDHEIDEPSNTFFNEFGSTGGAAPAGLTWEIDEPGLVFGNIFTHFSNSTAGGSLLDNTSGVPSGSPNDVSMALGSNFTLLAGEKADVTFNLETVAPTSGFYLKHTDPASNASVYFSSSTVITGVPEPATVAWGVACLAALTTRPRKRRRASA